MLFIYLELEQGLVKKTSSLVTRSEYTVRPSTRVAGLEKYVLSENEVQSLHATILGPHCIGQGRRNSAVNIIWCHWHAPNKILQR